MQQLAAAVIIGRKRRARVYDDGGGGRARAVYRIRFNYCDERTGPAVALTRTRAHSSRPHRPRRAFIQCQTIN